MLVRIDLEDGVPVLIGEFGRGRPPDDAGVVHDDVQVSSPRDGLGNQSVGLVPACEVGLERERGPSDARLDECLRRAGRRGVRVQHDVGARVGERQRDAGTEASAGTGDQGDVSVEAKGGR